MLSTFNLMVAKVISKLVLSSFIIDLCFVFGILIILQVISKVSYILSFVSLRIARVQRLKHFKSNLF